MARCPTRDRPTIERHLQSTLRHVSVGATLIDRQRTIVATLAAHRRSSDTARKLLDELEALQDMHVAQRDRLIDELAQSDD